MKRVVWYLELGDALISRRMCASLKRLEVISGHFSHNYLDRIPKPKPQVEETDMVPNLLIFSLQNLLLRLKIVHGD